jgi:thioredoxin-like negative regulator of GroEL
MPTLLEFSANWCVPCKQQEKELGKYKTLHPEIRIKEYKVDQPEGQVIAEQYGVSTLPTLVVLDSQGNVRGGVSGLQSVTQIEKLVQNAT